MLELRFSDFGEIWLLAHACGCWSMRLGAYFVCDSVYVLHSLRYFGEIGLLAHGADFFYFVYV